MAKTTKAVKSANAALDAAAEAAKDAKRLSKTLPKKDAKKLRDLADEAKHVANAKKKTVERSPLKVEKKAVAAIGRLEKAADKIETRLAAEAEAVKRAANKSAAKAAKKAAKAAAEPAAKDAEKPVAKSVDQSFAKDAENSAVEEFAKPATVPVAKAPAKGAGSILKSAPQAGSSVDLSTLTVIQLRAQARADGHSGFTRLSKAQLIDLLSA